MEAKTHDLNGPDRTALRIFGLVSGATILVLFGLVLPWLLKRPYPVWPWVPGGLLAVSALVLPNALRVIHGPWMRVALLLNRLTVPIIAGAVFFLVISPIGWIRRIAGSDPMARRFDRGAPTYRVQSRVSSPGNMERPF